VTLRVLAAIGVLCLAAPAAAAPKRDVRIETDPAGATVYLGDKESGSAGVTPLDLSLPAGEHTLIIELEGYVPRFEVVTVAGGRGAKKPQVFAFSLEPAVASISVEGEGFPAGARVFIDGEERGQPPLRVEVEPGAHQVEVVADGAKPFETWVEVAGGGEETVVASMTPKPRTALRSAPAPRPRAAARPPYATVGAGYEIGWRRFRYQQPRTQNAQPFDADGAGLIAVWLELHPQRAYAAARPVWPLSIVAGFRYGLPLETKLPGNMTADATWRTADAGLRWRLGLGRWAAVDFDAGWARTQFTFQGVAGASVDAVPDVDYQSLRLAARAVARLGPADVWIGGENLIVLSGGRVEDRFRGADADGYGVRAGVEARWWQRRITTRVDASWIRYGWTFATQDGDAFQAAGGDDDLYGVTLAAGVSY